MFPRKHFNTRFVLGSTLDYFASVMIRSRIFHLYLVVLISGAKSYNGDNVAKWSLGLRSLLKNCPPISWKDPGRENVFETLQRCLQRRALIAVDSFLDKDIIPIFNGIDLVRFGNKNSNSTNSELNSNQINTGRQNQDSSLWEILTNRISRIFQTHVLKFDVEHLTNFGTKSNSKSNDAVEGRRRHHRRRQGMMMMMMMGLLLMGSVLVPMGFQFLAVLGGKALILAKMALMLSSIQGLKKVATSGVNYGLYHAPVPETWHERSHLESSPPVFEMPYQPYPHIDRRH